MRLRNFVSSVLLILATGMPSVFADGISLGLNEQGVALQASGLGELVLQAPKLKLKDANGEKPVLELLDEKTAVARYASGTALHIELEGDTIRYRYEYAPVNGKSFENNMIVPLRFNRGGVAALDDQAFTLLPAELGGQFVVQGSGQSFTLISPSGNGIRLVTPGGYQELQDIRKFNWGAFGYKYYFDFFGRSEGEYFIRVEPVTRLPEASSEEGGTTNASLLQVDRYGQSYALDFSGKVTHDEELRADARQQEIEATAFEPNNDWDVYGGLAGSREKYGLDETGFFHVGTVDGRQVLVDPDGNAFFQLAMCGLFSSATKVKGREEIYEWLPPETGKFKTAWLHNRPDWGNASFYQANWIRKYDQPFDMETWTGQVVTRFRSWGFNSAGAFSEQTQVMDRMQVPYVAFLPVGRNHGVAVLPDKIGAAYLMDPFAPGVEEKLDKLFAEKVAPKAEDPLLVGYFQGNEQHMENLPKVIPAYKASKVAAKGALVDTLKNKYQTIERFNEAWQPAEPFDSFQALEEAPLFIRTEEASADMQAFTLLFLDKYYALVAGTFRKYDPNHLLIGSRWTPATASNQEIVEVAGRYLDTVSINYYTYAIDTTFLENVHEWSGGKPIILSEWYYSTTTRGLHGSRQMKDEVERGKAYRYYVEQAAALPFVVGVQWFTYKDQPITGRYFGGYHGEGNNTGFVDVADRPYAALVEAARQTHAQIYEVVLDETAPFAFDDPRFQDGEASGVKRTVQVPRAADGFVLDGTTNGWPGRPAEPIPSSRVVHGLADEAFRADYRLCWNEQYLYFNIQVMDSTPMKNNHQGATLWLGDAVELFIGTEKPDQGGLPMYSDRQILAGAGSSAELHIVDYPGDLGVCQLLVERSASGKGYNLQLALPWEVVGTKPRAGQQFLFDVAVDNSVDGQKRSQQLVWNGGSANSKDRGLWGLATLVAN